MGKEKRRAKRLDTKLGVKYGDVASFKSDYAINISKGGMFISTKKPLKVGATLSLEFIIPDIKVPIKVKGKVLWINDPKQIKGTNLIPGMGIKFQGLREKEKEKLNNFVGKVLLRQRS